MWPSKKANVAEESPEFCRFLDEEGEHLRRFLRKQDWETARRILGNTDPETRSYYVTVAVGTVGVEKWIRAVDRAAPDATLPLLLFAASLLTSAFELRRDGLASTMSDAAAELWTRMVHEAGECIDEVLAREPGNADAWAWSIAASRALDLPLPERRRRFQKLIEIEPAHWYGHEQMLTALTPAWGGDTEAMFDFARSRAAACPGTHVPTVLVLAHRAQNAHQSHLAAPDDPERPLSLTYYEPDAITDELWDAAHNSFWHDDYQISVLTPIVWNHFAYVFAWGDLHKSARNLFDSIGEDWITREPWRNIPFFLRTRDYTRDNLDD